MKPTSSKKTTIVENKYRLNDDLVYIETFSNDKLSSKELKYVGKLIDKDYNFLPLYNTSLDILKKTNPFWWNDKAICEQFFKNKLPPVDKIDVNKVIYACSWNHSFWDVNKEPIPVVQHVDYIDGGISNQHYDLEKLVIYAKQHPNIVKCSNILDIPYYNAEKYKNKYLDMYVLPAVEMLKKCHEKNWNRVVAHTAYKQDDFFGFNQFLKE